MEYQERSGEQLYKEYLKCLEEHNVDVTLNFLYLLSKEELNLLYLEIKKRGVI